MSETTFDITVLGSFTRLEVPPRCRNPRPVTYETQTVVHVPVVADAQAPVVLEVTDPGPTRAARTVRSYRGRLFAPKRCAGEERAAPEPGSPDFPARVDLRGSSSYLKPSVASAEEFADWAHGNWDGYLVVDVAGSPQVWVTCCEPRYVVQTFGLGHNHSSTALLTSFSDNPNIVAWAYFRADEFEAARGYAIDVASRRGDTDSIPVLLAQEPGIVVHDRSAVRLVTPAAETQEVAAARSALRAAADRYRTTVVPRAGRDGAVAEATAFGELAAARDRVRDLTEDVPGDGGEERPYEDR